MLIFIYNLDDSKLTIKSMQLKKHKQVILINKDI